MAHDDKREFYSTMGWCECNTCNRMFEDYEEYEEHVCTQGVDMTNKRFEFTWSME